MPCCPEWTRQIKSGVTYAVCAMIAFAPTVLFRHLFATRRSEAEGLGPGIDQFPKAMSLGQPLYKLIEDKADTTAGFEFTMGH